MNVAILGAAGSTGPVISRALIERGHNVRAVGRRQSRLMSACPGAEAVAADLSVPAQIEAALAGIDAAIFAVGLPYQDFDQYPRLTRNALVAAKRAGVERFLLIGTVYPYGPARTERVAETHPRTPHTRKGRARDEQLSIVLDAHGALQTAALILPDFYGPGLENTYLTSVFAGAVSGKSAPVIGPTDRLHEFVYVPDIGPVVGDFVSHERAFDGTAYHFGGAGTIVPREMYELAYRIGGNNLRLVTAGVTLQRLLGLTSPLMREMVEMNYLWREPVILDDTKLAALLGPLKKTPYDVGVRAGVEAARAAVERTRAAA